LHLGRADLQSGTLRAVRPREETKEIVVQPIIIPIGAAPPRRRLTRAEAVRRSVELLAAALAGSRWVEGMTPGQVSATLTAELENAIEGLRYNAIEEGGAA